MAAACTGCEWRLVAIVEKSSSGPLLARQTVKQFQEESASRTSRIALSISQGFQSYRLA